MFHVIYSYHIILNLIKVDEKIEEIRKKSTNEIKKIEKKVKGILSVLITVTVWLRLEVLIA